MTDPDIEDIVGLRARSRNPRPLPAWDAVVVHFHSGRPMTHIGTLVVGDKYIVISGGGRKSQYLRSEVDRLEVLIGNG